MQVKQIKSEGMSRELEVTVPLKTIEGYVESRLKEVGKTVRIKGFRPGKVPMAVLKKRYGRAILGEVLEQTVNETSAMALNQEELRPAMQPKIEVKEFEEGKDLTYKMEVEVLPEIKVMDFAKLDLEKPVAEADDKTIEEALQRIADNNKSSQKVEEDRATKKGDIVVMDFHGRTADDNVEHDGMHAHGHRLELGSGQFIPGFEDQLIDKKVGDKVEVKVSFPENYGAAELAGRDAIFDVDIHEIHEATDSKIDDDLAKNLGFDDLGALKEAVKQQIEADYDQHSRMKLKRKLLDALDEAHDIDAPERMVEQEYEGILQQIEREKQANPDAEGPTDEDKEELREIAGRRVRLGLLLSEIGSKNNVQVTDQELQQAVIREATKFPGQEKMVFEYYQKNPQVLDSLRAPIFEEKVCDIILGKAKVTEKKVSADELTSEDEEEAPKPKKKKSTATKSTAKKADGAEKKPAAKKKSTSKAKK